MSNDKITGYLGLSKRGNYLIIGSDNLLEYRKKLYLIVVNSTRSNNINKISSQKSEELGVPIIELLNKNIGEIIGIENCQIIGLKNKGLVDAILNKCQNEYKIINEVSSIDKQ